MKNVRAPAVAGQFYRGNEAGLRSQIEECFEDDHGPGEVPGVVEDSSELVGLVSPHAGYPYSGPIAAHGFYRLAKEGKPESVVILGPDHSGFGAGISFDDFDGWRTPLGDVEVDKDLRDNIFNKVGIAEIESASHRKEHSIEVQIPFLQYLFDDDFQIVPINIGRQDLEVIKALGEAIGEVASEDVLVIASTDFSHYESQDVARSKDRRAIEKIRDLDWEGFLDLVSGSSFSVCGYGPVSATILASKKRGAEKAEIFKYATSGDTSGFSGGGVVGYCSLGFF